MKKDKPKKKTDNELWSVIAHHIEVGNYIFLNHAKKRLKDRKITDTEVLDILEKRNHSKRNKAKDTYTTDYADWNYCIEGKNSDQQKIRIIISFNSLYMLIITIVRLES